ncbi:dihydrofolate reductase family protein [Microlunatus speluncae]|uniref:dihydrofolate reductase family protein n=1 Tax=Microlunatus speluncae TaxID=2594267 RepID=UPI0012667BAF|nr:dihydrofolate reductase family protein [Microlunatus speluncae]
MIKHTRLRAVAGGRRLLVVNFVSLDGGIQSVLSADEDREGGFTVGGWVPPYADDVLSSFMQGKTIGASGMVLGRKTYQGFVDAWADADQSQPVVAAMTRMPKYVASRTLAAGDWANTHILGPDVAAQLAALKRQPGDHLVVFGSGDLLRTLIEADLIDEYHLLIFPIVLGSGKRLFPRLELPLRLRHTDTTVTTTGVVINSYATPAA